VEERSHGEGQWRLMVQDKDVAVCLVTERSHSVVVGGTNFWVRDIHLSEDENNQLENVHQIDNSKEERTGHFYIYTVVSSDESGRVWMEE
jgi:hypothetical protein